MATRSVSAEASRPRIDLSHVAFETTEGVAPGIPVGEAAMRLQPRARSALELAVAARAPGFHVFASGCPHLVKLDGVLAVLRASAAHLPRADDWAAVFNEAEPERPLPLRLPPGEGPRFARAVADAVSRVKRELRRVLHSGPLRRREAALEAESGRAGEAALTELKDRLREKQFAVRRFEGQLEAVPLWKGKVVRRPLEALPAAQRKAIEARLPELSEVVEATNAKLGEITAGAEAKSQALRREAALKVVTHALEPLEREFAACPDAVHHLARLRAAMVEHFEFFLAIDPLQPTPAPPQPGAAQEDPLRRFAVHVLVTHAGESGAPVVKEGNPTGPSLFGTTSREVEFGVLTTDFTHLRAGALHRANGGFLVLPARALISQPEVWAALTRGLRTRELRMEDGNEVLASAAQPLTPAPVPLDCCVVLTGELEVFEALFEQDPDFRELFGVRADFDDTIAVDAGALTDATAVVAALVRQERLLPFDAGGVGRALEASLRRADDQQRLSLEWD